MSTDIGLDADAAESVARIIELVELVRRDHGPVAAGRLVQADITDATRAVEHSSAFAAYAFVDTALVGVLALDRGAHEWREVQRLVEDVGSLRLAAERSPRMPARECYCYGELRDALDACWSAVERLVELWELSDGSDGPDGL